MSSKRLSNLHGHESLPRNENHLYRLSGAFFTSATPYLELTWHSAIVASSHPGCRIIHILVRSRKPTTMVDKKKKIQSRMQMVNPLLGGTWSWVVRDIRFSSYASTQPGSMPLCRIAACATCRTFEPGGQKSQSWAPKRGDGAFVFAVNEDMTRGTV